MAYLKAGVKADTLNALRTAPLHLDTLFPDSCVKKAEVNITDFDRNRSSSVYKNRRYHPYERQEQTCHVPIAEGIKENNSIPRDRPRVSSSTNDNQCVVQLRPLLLTGSPVQETINTLNVKLDVVNSAHTAPGHSQKNEISAGRAVCYPEQSTLKSVKGVSCVIPLSRVNTKYCNKCSQCCHKSACRGQTAKVLEKVVRSGCWSESSSNPERGLHPPLSDPAKLVKNSHSHKLL